MNENKFSLLLNTFTPLFIICFFLLDSMLFRNLKGIIFLMGLSVSVIFTILVSNFIIPQSQINKICVPFTVNNSSTFINFPLTLNILLYTVTALMYSMASNNYIIPNIGFIFLMFSFIIINIHWLLQNNCFQTNNIIFSMIFGISGALIWNYILDKSKNKQYIYILGISSDKTCQIPKRKTYKCKTK